MVKKLHKFIASSTTAVIAAVTFFACSQTVSAPSQGSLEDEEIYSQSTSNKPTLEDIYEAVEKSGEYTTRDSVAAYLCKFDKLPKNYVGKNEGIKLYEEKGNTFEKWNFNPWTTLGVMIGGDVFSNSEGKLPEDKYYEADVDYNGKNRGTKRLVYQSGCIIYYTGDHYKTYTMLTFYM